MYHSFLIHSFTDGHWHLYDGNVGTFEIVPEAPYTSLVFLDSFFFFLFDWLVFWFFMFQIIDLILSFIHSTVVFPCKLFFISISVSFVSDWIFFMLLRSSLSYLSVLIISVLNSASDRLLISILFSLFLSF